MTEKNEAWTQMENIHHNPVGTLSDDQLLAVLEVHFTGPELMLAEIRKRRAGEFADEGSLAGEFIDASLRRVEALEEHQRRFGFAYAPKSGAAMRRHLQ